MLAVVMTGLPLLLAAATAATVAAPLPPGKGPNGDVVLGDTPIEGGFIKHCYTYEVGEVGELVGRLVGQCGDDELFDMLHYMWLDLNQCLGNYDGKLVWQDKGNAISKTSCINCSSRRFDTRWIGCQCRNIKGEWYITSLDLNEGVRYDKDHHVLACFGNYGVREDSTV